MSLRKFFSSLKNEAVSDIDSPCDYKHIKIVRFMLLIIRSWPQKELVEAEPYYQAVLLKYFYLCVCILCQIGSTMYVIIRMSELSFLEIGHINIITLMGGVDLSRSITLTLSTKYRNVVKEFLTKMHLLFYKNSSEYAMKTHNMVHLISHVFTLCLIGQMLTGLALFNLIPMYNNYAAGRYSSGGLQNSTFEHSLYFSYPFNVSTDVKGYIIACIIHCFTDKMSDAFGLMLFIYYVFHQACGCLLLLECSQMTAAALMRYLPLTLILTQQLIQLSVIFELVGSESEKLKDAVYGVPWECMDCANRRVVMFFLMNLQEPVHVKALGVANVGVTSMAMILKTSITYFTFLRSI